MTQTTVGDVANAAQIAYWNEVAGAKWVANQDRLDRLMAPLTDALLQVAAPRPGERVLDVGTGCGDLALRVADLVGPDGHVLGVDISKPMLAHAEARRLLLPRGARAAVDWQTADAMTHAFAPDADLLVSRFGVMFFEDPQRAFTNLRGAMRPGGRFAMLTWRRREEVEWMQAPIDWIASRLPVPDDVPGEIGPFAFAEPGTTCGMLTGAGFTDVVATPVDRDLVIGAAGPLAANDPAAAIEDAMIILSDTGPAARQLREAEPDARGEALDCLRAGVARHVRGGRVVLRGACWIYSGTIA
jgi:SAM-dependent methyltransferase